MTSSSSDEWSTRANAGSDTESSIFSSNEADKKYDVNAKRYEKQHFFMCMHIDQFF